MTLFWDGILSSEYGIILVLWCPTGGPRISIMRTFPQSKEYIFIFSPVESATAKYLYFGDISSFHIAISYGSPGKGKKHKKILRLGLKQEINCVTLNKSPSIPSVVCTSVKSGIGSEQDFPTLALLTLWNRSFYLWGGVRGDCSLPEECLAHSWLIPTRCL